MVALTLTNDSLNSSSHVVKYMIDLTVFKSCRRFFSTDFFVCGDSKGNMWFNQPPNLSTWTQRRPASILIFSHRPDHISIMQSCVSDELFV